MIPRLVRTAAVAALTVVVASAAAVGLSVPAFATTPSPIVLVSTDGVTYQPDLSVGLFAGAGLLVPGDTASSDLWIKNPISTPATVRVNVGDISSSSAELGENMELTAVDTLTGSTVRATWNQLAACDVMVLPVTIPGGAVLHVSLALAMMNAPGLVAQHQNASLTADIQMQDASAGSFPASNCDPGATDPGATGPGATGPGATGPGATGPGATQPGTTQPAAFQPRKILGYTGENFPTELLLLGGILVGVGWFLVVARKRRKREEAQQ